MSIVAVFSGAYCSAEAIAQKVADQLDYAVFGDELLQEAARKLGASDKMLARSMTGARAFLNMFTRDREKGLIYVRAALAEMLAKDDLVYLGPATHLIPKEISHVLRVGIVADDDYRVSLAKQTDGLDAEEAAEHIAEVDKARAEWTREIIGTIPSDPALYDIKIPLPTKDVDEAAALICESIRQDALRPTDKSVGAALDFRLAARLNLAILERGYYYCDVSSRDGSVTVIVQKDADPRGKLGRTMASLRFERLEEEIQEICSTMDEVRELEVRPGPGLRASSKVLLVDDEEEYVLTLSERLQTRDFESDVAHDGEQALSAVAQEEPEVMVLDLRMPGMDGMEVLRRVKRDHPNIEVIIVTGHGTEKDERMATELGAFAYLKKPVNIDVLAKTMKQASSKARGELSEAPSSEGPDSIPSDEA
ncbi:MAG: response regulator [Deltaproteobacteria bacterium]|jgi:CheY-like chemotaxis protein/cytidylate kinase|nr:response regulator [Deltaproteobacteria bacterium]MBW2532967.1 response regulator [Deltaproteobacteria bacterium]